MAIDYVIVGLVVTAVLLGGVGALARALMGIQKASLEGKFKWDGVRFFTDMGLGLICGGVALLLLLVAGPVAYAQAALSGFLAGIAGADFLGSLVAAKTNKK